MDVLDRLFPFEATDEGILQSAAERTRTVQRQGCHDVILVACPDLAQRGTHPWTLDLKAADRLPLLDAVRGGNVICWRGIQYCQRCGELTRSALMNEFCHIAYDRQTTDTQQIDLYQP